LFFVLIKNPISDRWIPEMKLWKKNQWSDPLVKMVRNEPEPDTPVEPNEKGYERETKNCGQQFFLKGAAEKYIPCRNRDNIQTNIN
jgi:hypothetical protein